MCPVIASPATPRLRRDSAIHKGPFFSVVMFLVTLLIAQCLTTHAWAFDDPLYQKFSTKPTGRSISRLNRETDAMNQTIAAMNERIHDLGIRNDRKTPDDPDLPKSGNPLTLKTDSNQLVPSIVVEEIQETTDLFDRTQERITSFDTPLGNVNVTGWELTVSVNLPKGTELDTIAYQHPGYLNTYHARVPYDVFSPSFSDAASQQGFDLNQWTNYDGYVTSNIRFRDTIPWQVGLEKPAIYYQLINEGKAVFSVYIFETAVSEANPAHTTVDTHATDYANKDKYGLLGPGPGGYGYGKYMNKTYMIGYIENGRPVFVSQFQEYKDGKVVQNPQWSRDPLVPVQSAARAPEINNGPTNSALRSKTTAYLPQQIPIYSPLTSSRSRELSYKNGPMNTNHRNVSSAVSPSIPKEIIRNPVIKDALESAVLTFVQTLTPLPNVSALLPLKIGNIVSFVMNQLVKLLESIAQFNPALVQMILQSLANLEESARQEFLMALRPYYELLFQALGTLVSRLNLELPHPPAQDPVNVSAEEELWRGHIDSLVERIMQLYRSPLSDPSLLEAMGRFVALQEDLYARFVEPNRKHYLNSMGGMASFILKELREAVDPSKGIVTHVSDDKVRSLIQLSDENK